MCSLLISQFRGVDRGAINTFLSLSKFLFLISVLRDVSCKKMFSYARGQCSQSGGSVRSKQHSAETIAEKMRFHVTCTHRHHLVEGCEQRIHCFVSEGIMDEREGGVYLRDHIPECFYKSEEGAALLCGPSGQV